MVRISLQDQILNNNVPEKGFVKRGKPRWLRMQMPNSPNYMALKSLVETHDLHTVCQEAACPNMGECWSNGVATVMILGDTCTRACGFCNVKTGKPPVLDLEEPGRVADAIRIMDLNYVVITSVNRDELPDGGARIWAETIEKTREVSPKTKIEVLIPDFCGDWDALQVVLDAKPDVLAHNVETVKRLHRPVRPQARYERTMEMLRRSKEQGAITKTGFMAGIGETDEEIYELLRDLKNMTTTSKGEWIDIISVGQYLQPSPKHLPVDRFVHPDVFDEYKRYGEKEVGLLHVESGPMVRSSYHADKQAAKAAREG